MWGGGIVALYEFSLMGVSCVLFLVRLQIERKKEGHKKTDRKKRGEMSSESETEKTGQEAAPTSNITKRKGEG